MIYILKHQDKDFTGMCGHVYFEKGRGSTSDDIDAKQCVEKFGCEDITEEYWATKKKEEALKKAREAKAEKEAAAKKKKEEKPKEPK
jgi:hypothetical protein